jgi:hypothetical protein
MAGRKFAALAGFKQNPTEQLPEQPHESPVSVPAPVRGKGRPPGKRSDPDFQPTTLLLREQTKRTANRILQDKKLKKDLSDLTEQLLTEWIARQM